MQPEERPTLWTGQHYNENFLLPLSPSWEGKMDQNFHHETIFDTPQNCSECKHMWTYVGHLIQDLSSDYVFMYVYSCTLQYASTSTFNLYNDTTDKGLFL